jgi:putative restriction endonuclease
LLLTKIAQAIGVETPKIRSGSTVTKEIFLLVNEVLGLSLDGDLSKPELSRTIVETAGHDWLSSHESKGGTITTGGLEAVLAAVKVHIGAEPTTRQPERARERIIGHIPGIRVGTEFPNRRAVSAAGVHRPPQAGISGNSVDGADSIVVSGGYVDDSDSGDQIVYTGHGGNDPVTKRQVADQELTRGNLALVISHNRGLPVRVVRGWKGHPAYSPDAGYRYDGLYSVARYWSEVGVNGYVIWRYELHQRHD